MKLFLFFIIAVITITLSSCKTYYISTDSLKQQFSGIDSSTLKDVVVQGPGWQKIRYKANPITMIQCVDKNNQPFELPNGPSIEMRVTHDRKKSIFYFDRVVVNDSTLKGVKSRFFSSITQTIPLASITKIEVQDGGKKYSYVNE
jgi:hypothetical protein